MTFQSLKTEVESLADADRRRLLAYLVSIEDAKSRDHAARLAEKIDDSNPSNWVSLEELEKGLEIEDDR